MLSEIKMFGGLLSIAVLAGGFGCSKAKPENDRVTIVPILETRVTALDFERGDRIGLSIVRTAGTYADNVPMTYDGIAFSDGPAWYAERQEPSTLTAYYPYSAAGVPSEFSVAADQRVGCVLSDLLGATSSGVLPGAGPVKMIFNHLLSQLTVVVNNRSGKAVSGVALSGFSPMAQVDFGKLEVAAVPTAGAGEVLACEEEAGISYRAILVPQCADLTVTVALADGSVYGKTVANAALESRKSYVVSVDVGVDALGVVLSGEIRDWIDGGTIDAMVGGGDSAGGDSEDTGKSGGDDGGLLDYGGGRYRTVTLGGKVWMAENLRYMPPQATLGSGVWYPKEGVAVIAEKGLLYDRATALGGDAYAAGISVPGICPEGWHLPDREELEMLVRAGYGTDFFVDSGCWILSPLKAEYGSSSYLMGTTLSGDSMMECLKIGTSSILSVPVSYGVSVRCVEDRGL